MPRVDWDDTYIMPPLGTADRAVWPASFRPPTSFRPICAVCKIPIYRFTDSYDPARRVYLFRFECHGREEIVPVDQSDIEINPDYVWRALWSYRPFANEAEQMRQRSVAYVPGKVEPKVQQFVSSMGPVEPPTQPPKPKPEDFLVPARKPRVIILED